MINPMTKERVHTMDGIVLLVAAVVVLTPIGWDGALCFLFGYFVFDIFLARMRAIEGRSFK